MRPYQPRQPSPPHRPVDFTITEVAPEEPQQAADRDLEEAIEGYRR